MKYYDNKVRYDLSQMFLAYKSLNLKYMRYAIWHGRKNSPHFFENYPHDFYQTVMLASVEAESLSERDANAVIKRHFYHALKSFGYSRTPDKCRWVPETSVQVENWEKLNWKERLGVIRVELEARKPKCGVPTCDRESSNNDQKFVRLCARCFLYVNKRKRKGMQFPYDFIEENAAKKASA